MIAISVMSLSKKGYIQMSRALNSFKAKASAAALIALAGAFAQAPSATAEPPQPRAGTTYCDIGQGPDPSGVPYGGKAKGPTPARVGGKGAYYANYEIKCTENVTVVLHWNVLGPAAGDNSSGDVTLQLTGCGSGAATCSAFFQTPTKKLGYNLNGDKSFSASGTADVFPAGTPFPSGTPLQSFKVLTSIARI